MEGLRVAVVGATGLVGQKILEILGAGRIRVAELRPMASQRSAGSSVEFRGRKLTVIPAGPREFAGCDVAFFAAGSSVSKELAPAAVKQGAICIDKSNAFRMDPSVPLVVPEVNSADLALHSGLIASPNCSTIQLVMVLKPLHDAVGLERVVVSTYQSVSGTGHAAVAELRQQSIDILEGREARAVVYSHLIAFNLIPQIDSFDDSGYTLEERKLMNESRKILGLPDLKVTATAVRAPVFFAHCEAVNLQTRKPLTPANAKRLLGEAEGVSVIDDPTQHLYPTPVDASGRDEVFVGRIREDHSAKNGLDLWIVADNLRKGAATNAVQILEALIRRGMV